MDCAGIQELLSEYIDGALDAQTARTVGNHISTCKDCKDMFASLSAVVEELNALEPMEAPADFLEKIHERMEPRPRVNRLFRKLFVPFKIKIPLQLAAAALVSILVVLVFNLQKSEFQMIQPYTAYKSEGIAETPKADHITPLYKNEKKHPAPVFEEAPARMSDSKAGGRARRSGVKSFAQPLTQKKSDPSSYRSAKTGPSAGKGRPIELTLVLNTGVLGASSRPNLAVKAPMRESDETSGEKENIDKDVSGRDIENRQKNQCEYFIPGMTHILNPLGGKILSVDYHKQIKRLTSILVQIPGKNYASFCKELNRMAAFKTPPPALSDEIPETVEVLIRFDYPK